MRGYIRPAARSGKPSVARVARLGRRGRGRGVELLIKNEAAHRATERIPCRLLPLELIFHVSRLVQRPHLRNCSSREELSHMANKL